VFTECAAADLDYSRPMREGLLCHRLCADRETGFPSSIVTESELVSLSCQPRCCTPS
jgi:hypothetical protein